MKEKQYQILLLLFFTKKKVNCKANIFCFNNIYLQQRVREREEEEMNALEITTNLTHKLIGLGTERTNSFNRSYLDYTEYLPILESVLDES